MADLTWLMQEKENEFEPLPEGSYSAVIIGSEMGANGSGNGRHLRLTFQITSGPYEGWLLWSRLNLDHPSPRVKQIARSELAAISRAVGVKSPNDSSDLHGVEIIIRVRQRFRRDTGEAASEIKQYVPCRCRGRRSWRPSPTTINPRE